MDTKLAAQVWASLLHSCTKFALPPPFPSAALKFGKSCAQICTHLPFKKLMMHVCDYIVTLLLAGVFSIDFDKSQLSAERQIYCGQGPAPPSPMVVERFQQVISQLFQQVPGHLFSRPAFIR